MCFLALYYKATAEGGDLTVKRSDALLHCGAPPAPCTLPSAKELSYTVTAQRVMEKHFNKEMLLTHTRFACMWRLTF